MDFQTVRNSFRGLTQRQLHFCNRRFSLIGEGQIAHFDWISMPFSKAVSNIVGLNCFDDCTLISIRYDSVISNGLFKHV
jgi:hypothetical protein